MSLGLERRIIGGALIALGTLGLLEARRLAALREQLVAGAVVGDDTFPRIVGAAMIVLGVHAIFLARWPARSAAFPVGVERRRLTASALALVAYCVLAPTLGYAVSTLGVSTVLYRSMGGYRWPVALAIGGVTTGVLVLVFRVWLLEPLPTGWVGA
jgi:hypothetical protein